MACTCGPGQECQPLKPGCWGYVDPLERVEALIDAILRGRHAGWDQAMAKLRVELREIIKSQTPSS